jgi:tetratricopeptide (TPR) repeat protein
VSGLCFLPDVIAKAMNLGESILTDVLRSLEQDHRILHCRGSTYLFDHAVIEDAIYTSMSRDLRRKLHGLIGDALKRMTYGMVGADTMYDIAYHYRKGNETLKALAYLQPVGDMANESLGFLEALQFYESGLTVLGDNDSSLTARNQKMDLLMHVGDVEQTIGGWDGSMAKFELVLSLSRELGDSRMEGSALMKIGLAYAKRGFWSEAESHYDQSLELFRRLGDQEKVGLIETSMADINLARCEWRVAENRYREALSIAMRTVNRHLMARIYSRLGAISDLHGELMIAILNYRNSLDLFKELGEYLGMAQVYHELGVMHASGQRYEKALEFYDKSIELAQKTGEIALTARIHLHKAMALIKLLRINEAAELCEQVERYLSGAEDPIVLAECNVVLGMLGVRKGEWHYAQRRFEDSIHILQSCGDVLRLARSLREMGNMYAARGMNNTALEMFKKAVDIYQQLGVKSLVEELTIKIKAIDTPSHTPESHVGH